MADFFGISGKTALVIGGGGSMGKACALRLAQAGAHVAVADILPEAAQAVAAQIGANSRAYKVDVTEDRQVEQLFADVEADMGGADIMVTVVGMATFKNLLDLTLDDWDLDHGRNLRQVFYSAKLFASSRRHAGRPGALVVISSVSGLQAAPHHGAYGAAKAGLSALVKTMAVEWAPYGIRANAIAPGLVETDRILPTPARVATVRQRIPMARLGTIDEIAKASLFLASDMASFTTGHTLDVDGGWMAATLMDAERDAGMAIGN